MTEVLPQFRLLRPTGIDELIASRTHYPDGRFVAGGTDLIVNMRKGLVDCSALVDVTGVEALQALEFTSAGARIGAAVNLATLAKHADVRERYPAVAQAAESVAGPGHRETATLGGNLCQETRCLYYNQSAWWRKANGYCLKRGGDTCHVAPQGARCRAAFCSDLAPALMVHDAEVELAGQQGQRRLPLADLYRNDGAAHLTLAADEVLVAVILPPPDWRSLYDKARIRDSIDFPLAGVAVATGRVGPGEMHVRVAVTGTDSRPVLIGGLEDPVELPITEDMTARVAKLVQKQVSPVRTGTVSPNYRRTAAAALAQRLLSRLAAEAGR